MVSNKPLSSKELIAAKKKSVFKFLFIQLVFAFLTAGFVWFSFDKVVAYSFLLGALSSLVPSLYFAFRVFGKVGVRPAQEIVKSFYRGEAGKLVMTSVILSLVFILVKPLVAGAFFCGFGLAILSHWLSPAFIRH
ncbi:ATP synthase subunit I [Marinomonas sp. 15G1-11]|uniref:ATP synthase subunit I n=1 Tax=Marinomonas phaeophyticola TaxID=3004091 RepID=A0ABT4JW75_9GAMM|nr:ATP synthase subunit I [Marinomonas sp. 15G1-11]MCZ2721829.1 ATP synthase subunit I [Marinomonas sp. 15G1-11]